MREVKLYLASCADNHAEQHAAGRALLARALADAGLSPALPVAADASGKPFLPDAPGLHFSIAHCGERVVCAVAGCPVGADLERERALRYDIAERICTSAERAVLRTDADRFALWTGKEAAVKAVGLGLRLPLRTVEVGLEEARTVEVDGIRCFLRRPAPVDGWHLAVCLAGSQEFKLITIPAIA